MEIIPIVFAWILLVGVSLLLMVEAGKYNHAGDIPPPPPRPRDGES